MAKLNFKSKIFYVFILFGAIILINNQVSANLPCNKNKCGANEIFSCEGGPCQTYCSQLNRYCCINNIFPNQACYCVGGYARNDDGKCIPINCKECKDLVLPENETDNCATQF